MTDLTALSPAQIDELWAPLHYATVEAYWAEADARSARSLAQRKLDGEVKRTMDFTGRSVKYTDTDEALTQLIERADAALPGLHETWRKANEAEAPFETEWARRGGWTRAYLVVTNGQGHVHRSTHCSTCYATTRFEWLTEQSGKDEAEIVELAGERACTACYPSAPVDVTKRATKLFGEAEKARQAERAERAAKKAAAEGEKITVEGYLDFGRKSTKVFRTVRGATNAIAGELSSLTWYGETHPSAGEWKSNVETIRAALAAKGVDYDYDKALAAARKKVVREGGQAKY